MKWMRFQPPGPGWAPSAMGRAAELCRPAQQQPQVAALDVGECRRKRCQHGEAEMAGVEVDGGGDVVDQIADADCGVIGHGWDLLGMRTAGR